MGEVRRPRSEPGYGPATGQSPSEWLTRDVPMMMSRRLPEEKRGVLFASVTVAVHSKRSVSTATVSNHGTCTLDFSF